MRARLGRNVAATLPHYFARGVQRIYADGSLEFACAMEPGMVLTVAQPGEMVAELNEMFNSMRHSIGPAELVIGFECAARTAEMEQSGLTEAVSKVFRGNSVVGFCTLGEQFNTIHSARNSWAWRTPPASTCVSCPAVRGCAPTCICWKRYCAIL